MGEWTPGPWWTDAKYNGKEMGCAVIAARIDSGPLPGNPTRGMVTFATATLNTEARRCEANARLIAAAPDLAEAVRRQVENIERWRETGIPATPEESKSIYEQLLAALTRATGG